MYLDGLTFLEEERDAFRPFEALAALPDERLLEPSEAAHGWSGRDLMVHLVAWQRLALEAARELAVGESSPTMDRVDREWEAGGDALNARLAAEWADRPLADVRHEFATVPGELRGYLTVVPESRWIKNPGHLRFLLAETTEHYAEHEGDLAAILAPVAGPGT